MNVKDQLAIEYAWLAEGQTAAGQMCPMCNGGSTKEQTLSVSRVGSNILWKCHRSSCTFAGGTSGGRPVSPMLKVQSRGVWGRQCVREADALPVWATDWLKENVGINERQISKHQLGWADGRLVQPIFNFQYELLGCNLRSLDGHQPKNKLHCESGALAWYINQTTTELIIVEDIFSAIRVSEYMNSVALLSTHLNDERVEEIKRAGCGPVYLALDNDAFAKTISYCKRWRWMTPVVMTKDLKNLSEQELEEFVDEIKN